MSLTVINLDASRDLLERANPLVTDENESSSDIPRQDEAIAFEVS